MVQIYDDVQKGADDYFPADFHASEEFEKIPMSYFQLSNE
jgi:hypothetical protein